MRLLLSITTLTFGLLLSACGLFGETLSYDDFETDHVSSYYQAEHQSNNRYILYYYDSADRYDSDFNEELFTFFSTFTDLQFYMLDTTNIETEISDFGAYSDEPIIYVVSNNSVYEKYEGENQIKAFMLLYRDITYDYDLFSSQHLNSFQNALSITNDAYILYYYDDDDSVPTDFLKWAFTKSAEDIYFINSDDLPQPVEYPSELITLRDGTPMMIVLSSGSFTGEYYEGDEAIYGYAERVGTLDILANDMTLDYSDFADYMMTSYDESLTISDNLHLEYYYSPYCSHCNAIKATVLSFFDGLTDVEYYLINASAATGTVKIDSFYGTPTLYVVSNNEVVLELVGSLAIPEFIQQYYNGDIDWSTYE